jgi:BirA family biotin operon repressor/biotin-[acetyl-CoA-carboxylase] ligase
MSAGSAGDKYFSPESLSRPRSLIGCKVEVFDRLGSTNDELMRRAEQGAQEGLVIIAQSQDKGRGRLGRTWESPPGINLLLSVLLRPGILPEKAPMITLFAAVAVARAVEKETGLCPRIKWPNDLELSGKKVCGILTEMSAVSGGKAAPPERVEYVVVGIGLNVNMDTRDLPPEIAEQATSLSAELGRPVKRAGLARTLFEELERTYEDFLHGKKDAMFEAWHERARMRGEDVKVLLDGRVLEGRVKDLDEHGALLLETGEGLRRILAGEVQWVRRR